VGEDTGFDPMELPRASTRPPGVGKKEGGGDKGAVGAIIGDSSKSDRRGATAGALVGGTRQASSNKQVEQERH
jgi:hypothetical protein